MDPCSDAGRVKPNPGLERQGNEIVAAVVRRPALTIPSTVQAKADSHFSPFSCVSNHGAASKFESPPGWTVDLGLMNHYTSLTSSTLPGADRRTWQREVPTEAVAHPFLMHQVLAVSAFHLASLDPSQSQTHLSRAFQHQHHAICGIKAEVSDITPSNCHALFAASSLLFIGAFASSTQATTGGTSQREVNSILDIFTLVRGVIAILSSSKEIIRHGIFGEFMQCNDPPARTGLLSLLLERLPRIRESLAANPMSHEAQALVEEAIVGLRESVERASTRSPELTVAVVWPTTLSDGFLALLRVHHPAALVVVAHYCAVLHVVGSEFWFIRGWGRRLIDAIAESLVPCWREVIRWPLDFIKSSGASGS